MAARVIHFGPDDCHRLMVLRSAGYSVDDCQSLLQLRDSLSRDAAADALLVSDADGTEPLEALALVRARSSAPVILFRSTIRSYRETGVDLVVDSLTPPEVWLPEMDAVIQKSRTVHAEAQALLQESRQLRGESVAAREHSRAERDRSRREYERNPVFSASDPFPAKLGRK